MITPPNRPPGFADAGRNCPVQARMRLNGEITPLRAASTIAWFSDLRLALFHI